MWTKENNSFLGRIGFDGRFVRGPAGRSGREPDRGMSAAMAQDRRPGDTDMHRRQRGKNLFIAGFLLVLVVLFFGLTIVRMGGYG